MRHTECAIKLLVRARTATTQVGPAALPGARSLEARSGAVVRARHNHGVPRGQRAAAPNPLAHPLLFGRAPAMKSPQSYEGKLTKKGRARQMTKPEQQHICKFINALTESDVLCPHRLARGQAGGVPSGARWEAHHHIFSAQLLRPNVSVCGGRGTASGRCGLRRSCDCAPVIARL